MKKESILTGALVLTITGIITRIIGFYYRIYMTGVIGSEGMGLYQLIMPIYLLSWTITSSGITTTVSSLTAKTTALKRYNESSNILKSALIITGALSIAVEIIVFFFSPFISEFIIKDIRAITSLKIISLCFPFMSMGSSIRGYFYGIQNSSIPAASQITEQLVRVFSVITIFSFYSPSDLGSACAVTSIGIALGEIISFIFTLISFLKFKNTIHFEKTGFKPKNYIPMILSSAIPLSSGRILNSVLSTIENLLIPQKLISYGYTESNALSVYGKLTGMAMPLIQFPTAILTSFSTALIPAISSAINIRNNDSIKHTIEKSLLFSSVAGMWALTVFLFFPKHTSFLLYNQSSLGSMVIKLAPLCPFIYTHITLSGILNGLGKQKIIFLNNMISSVTNLFFIQFLMPYLGIDSFISGLFLSLVLTTLLSIIVIIHTSGIKLKITGIILKPMVCSISSGIIIRCFRFTYSFSKTNIVLSLLFISTIYLLLTIFTGCLKINDLKSLIPKRFIIKKQV